MAIEWAALAIVEVNFHQEIFNDSELGALEELLRSQKNVDNLSVHKKGINFFIWGREKIDYRVLDQLKAMLESWGISGFEINAKEYFESGNNYRHFSPALKHN